MAKSQFQSQKTCFSIENGHNERKKRQPVELKSTTETTKMRDGKKAEVQHILFNAHHAFYRLKLYTFGILVAIAIWNMAKSRPNQMNYSTK